MFCAAIDWILQHMQPVSHVHVDMHTSTNFVYAEDMTLFLLVSDNAISCRAWFNKIVATFRHETSWVRMKLQNLGSQLLSNYNFQ